MVPPEIPVLVGDTNAMLIRHEMSLPNIKVLGNGACPSFECRGETVYQILDETYAEYHYPVPPWLKIPMRATVGPRIDPNYVLTGGAVGAAQDGAINPMLEKRWGGSMAESPEPPLAGDDGTAPAVNP